MYIFVYVSTSSYPEEHTLIEYELVSACYIVFYNLNKKNFPSLTAFGSGHFLPLYFIFLLYEPSYPSSKPLGHIWSGSSHVEPSRPNLCPNLSMDHLASTLDRTQSQAVRTLESGIWWLGGLSYTWKGTLTLGTQRTPSKCIHKLNVNTWLKLKINKKTKQITK